jgi:hypothetical protein
MRVERQRVLLLTRLRADAVEVRLAGVHNADHVAGKALGF